MEETAPIFYIRSIEKEKKELKKAYREFLKDIDKLLETLWGKIDLSLRSVVRPDYKLLSQCVINNDEPCEYIYFGKDSNKRLIFCFFQNGKISVTMYWHNKTHEKIKYEDISPQRLLEEIAPKIKEHLGPEPSP